MMNLFKNGKINPTFSTIYFLSQIWSASCYVTEMEDCRLVSGNPGVCVGLGRCNVVIQLLQNLQKPLPKDVGLLIKESFFCGPGSLGELLVCCPPSAVNPRPVITNKVDIDDIGDCKLQGGIAAVCTPYTQCSPFLLLLANLRKPLPPAIPEIMREVYLCGRGEAGYGQSVPKICCPSEGITTIFLTGEHRETSTTTTSTTTTTTTTTTSTTTSTSTTTQKSTSSMAWYKNHPGMKYVGSLETCGRPLSLGMVRVVGGVDAKLGQFPWLTNIGYAVSDSDQLKYQCGGTLIGVRHVLTAAHCVVSLPQSYTLSQVRVGEHDLSNSQPDCIKKECAPLPQDIEIEKIITHPEYNKPHRFNNDIAILKLSRAIQESDFVSPVCLPFPDFDPLMPKPDTEGYRFLDVAGWGATDMYARRFADVLQYVKVPLFEFDSCTDLYRQQRVKLIESQLCAGGKEGKDSCSGDSGSGLMTEAFFPNRPFDPRGVQVGVVSFGPRRCATKGMPAVYTNVSHYLPWILDSLLE